MEFKKVWYYLICTFCTLCISCATSYKPLDPGTFYKRDMRYEVKGLGEFEGVAVLPEQKSYTFLIEPKDDDPDMLIVRSCHRDHDYEAEKKSFFFIPLPGNKFQYNYTPIPGLETNRVCPLRGDAYHEDKNNSQHSWFFVDFENPSMGYDIQARLICNSDYHNINGVAVCQVRSGLMQALEFNEEIRWAPVKPDHCNQWVNKGNYRWELEVSMGECLYHGQNRKGKLFRITTIGFEGIHLRRGV